MMVLHYSDSPWAELLPNEMVCSVLCGLWTTAITAIAQYHIMPTFSPGQAGERQNILDNFRLLLSTIIWGSL